VMDTGLGESPDREDCRVEVDGHEAAEQLSGARPLYKQMRTRSFKRRDAARIGWDRCAQSRFERGLAPSGYPILVWRNAKDHVVSSGSGADRRVGQGSAKDSGRACGNARGGAWIGSDMKELIVSHFAEPHGRVGLGSMCAEGVEALER
jgi:hypothetical protein